MRLTFRDTLPSMFLPEHVRRGALHRRACKRATALAQIHGIRIKRLRGGGFNLLPPARLTDANNP